MDADRLLDLLSLLALACVGIAGLARGIALAARGRWVLPIDRERSPLEGLVDLAFLVGMVLWVAEAIATATARDWSLVPDRLRDVEIPWLAIRWLGVVSAGAGVAIYVAALRDLGLSWRLTIDRERPGELVTRGVFARTRNPIYLGLTLLALGVSLALGSAPLLVLASGAWLYFPYLVRREERFLAAHYGAAYADYRVHVPRWLRRPGQRHP